MCILHKGFHLCLSLFYFNIVPRALILAFTVNRVLNSFLETVLFMTLFLISFFLAILFFISPPSFQLQKFRCDQGLLEFFHQFNYFLSLQIPMGSSTTPTSSNPSSQPTIFKEFLKWYEDHQNFGSIATVAHLGISFVASLIPTLMALGFWNQVPHITLVVIKTIWFLLIPFTNIMTIYYMWWALNQGYIS